MNNYILFQDQVDVRSLNDCGKKFERVNRLHCKGVLYNVVFVIDVNCELFKVKAGDKLEIALSSSLNGAADDGNFDPSLSSALLDKYDYVMHGRVFNIKHIEDQNVEVQASFGGMLMKLIGEQAHVEQLSMDMTFFLLMRILKHGGAMEY
jgi:DNA-directed RNA polymerase I, II, and III subunit RPABC3